MARNKSIQELLKKIQKATSLANKTAGPLKMLNHPTLKRAREIQKMHERFHSRVNQEFAAVQKTLAQYHQPFLKQALAAQKMAEPHQNLMAQYYPRIFNAAQLGQKIMAQTLPAIQRWREAIEERVEAYPEIKPKIKALADNGWFLSSDYVLMWRLDEFTDSDLAGDALHAHMEAHYKENFDDLVESLITRYPKRAEHFTQAARAHREGMYCLSIPSFFAQADGISKEEFGRYLFQGKHGEGNIAAEKPLLEDEEDLLEITKDIFWTSFDERPPIAQTINERGKSGYTGLNRHTTLHGDETDYGTETNSLKTFSLLCHIHALTHFKDDEYEEGGENAK